MRKLPPDWADEIAHGFGIAAMVAEPWPDFPIGAAVVAPPPPPAAGRGDPGRFDCRRRAVVMFQIVRA